MIDAHGVLVACANESLDSACVPPTIRFSLVGDGEIAAVGSGDPIDPSGFHAAAADGTVPRKSYRGRATAIGRPGKGPAAAAAHRLAAPGSTAGEHAAAYGRVVSSGKLTITAAAAGLESATLTLDVSSAACSLVV